jgi:hypothetical protein
VKLTGEWQRWQRLYEMRQGTGSSEAWNHPNRATGGRGAQRRVLGRRSGHRRGDTVKGALGAFFIAEAAHSTLGMKGKRMGGGGFGGVCMWDSHGGEQGGPAPDRSPGAVMCVRLGWHGLLKIREGAG